MEKELISIIIPIYNTDKYINRCLQSVIAQTYKKIEIILIDDGSTDKSFEICKKYSNQDSRIRLIHQNNRGSSATRNRGIKEATGKMITFIDSDDWINEKYIETLYYNMIYNKAQLSVCGYQRVAEEKKVVTKEEKILPVTETRR